MKRAATGRACAAALAVVVAGGFPAFAQEPDAAAKKLKSDISDAQNLQRVFADGLQHCAALNGTGFYNAVQKRVVVLSELRASIQNLINDQVFNAQKTHLWSKEDLDERMKAAQLQADKDKTSCALVARLPDMVKELAAIEARK